MVSKLFYKDYTPLHTSFSKPFMQKQFTKNNLKPSLGVVTLALMNVAAIASLRNLPVMASCGLSLFFYYGLSIIIFFIPSALISAELATMFSHKEGGVSTWVTEALGPKWGFFTAWCMMAKGFTYFPAVIAFVAGTFSLLVNPHWAESSWYTMGMIVLIMWGGTLLNCRGVKLSNIVSSLGCTVGTIFPGLVIVSLALYWILSGRPAVLSFEGSYLPNIDSFSELAFLAGTFIAFSGIELSATHVREVYNPQKNFPKAILLCAVIVLGISILGSLAVALVIPKENISLDAGIMQAFNTMFAQIGFPKIAKLMGICVLFGALATINIWIMNPVRSLHANAKDHSYLPAYFRQLNKAQAPQRLLVFQAIVVSLMTFIFFPLMPSVNSTFWLLTATTSNIYMLGLLFMFASAIYLRFKRPDLIRPFKVPGGQFGMLLLGGSGFCSTLFVFLIGFVPPSSLDMGPWALYLNIGSTALIAGSALLYVRLKKLAA
jgi:glutamate:GABA antiporter